MKPIDFPESNNTFKKPADMESCVDLPVFHDGKQSISKWEMTPEEIEHVVKHGFIWLRVFGAGHPPILPEATETVFISPDEHKQVKNMMDDIIKKGTENG